jgi:choline dehydrogenase-like flavoprotein
VGGSTLLNRMVWDRASQADYNRWATLLSSDWTWSSLLPWFKKVELFTPPGAAIAKEYNITYDPSVHGTSGYLKASYAPWFWPSTSKLASSNAHTIRLVMLFQRCSSLLWSP